MSDTFRELVGAEGVELGVEDGAFVVKTNKTERARIDHTGNATGAFAGGGAGASSLSALLGSSTDAGAHPITDLANPTNPQDAATKSYVDSSAAAAQSAAETAAEGYTDTSVAAVSLASLLTKSTDAGAHAITNVTDPADAQDAATKAYVDAAVAGVPVGGHMDVVVAASNAPAAVKTLADYVCDGVDDHVQIQAAIDSVAGGGRVILSQGDFSGGQLVLKNLVWLRGAGMRATRYQLKAGQNVDAIINYVSADGIESNGEYVTISDLMVDANKANQTAGRGIFFSNNPQATKATNDLDFDPHNRVENVLILNAKGDGFAATNRSETRLVNVYTMGCDGNGFNPSYDTFMSRCTAAWSGLAGFNFQSSSVRASVCKAFYSGQVTAGSGKGFNLKSTHGVVLAACEAQDNKDAGFLLDTCFGCELQACSADSNSTRFVGTAPGVDIWGGSDNVVDVVCVERKADGTNSWQQHALRIRNGSSGNSVRVSHTAAGTATIGAAIDSGSTGLNLNDIIVNGSTHIVSYPTADPHVVGQLWSNAGVVTVSAG